jgi:hypothetical protein
MKTLLKRTCENAKWRGAGKFIVKSFYCDNPATEKIEGYWLCSLHAEKARKLCGGHE